ncbi:MAG TPA: adenylate/guanylate cyclase domain-containing protein [Solimonas sp.]|nr:adenylate/guanylate cyclase domain-containing protein [Solimonas sp.]
MIPREFAAASSRLLAVYCGVQALQVLAVLPWLQRPPLMAWTPGLASLLLWLLVAALLWTQAPRLAGWLAAPARSRVAPVERLFVVLAGCFVLIDAMTGLLGLLGRRLLQEGLQGLHADAALLLPLALQLLQFGAGVGLLLVAPWLARRHVPPAPLPAVDTRLPRALGELIGNVSVTGLNKLTELALTLKDEAEGHAIRAMKTSMDVVIAAVQGKRPDFSGALSADGTVTIVFSDMEGFSTMTERLGDQQAHKLIRQHNDLVRGELQRHGGKEVELQGDGFLLAFGDAAAALRCAVAIQRAFAKYSARQPQEPMRVRIGLHTGKPIKEGDRFFGLTVILAARIAGQAKGGEILASAALRERFVDDPEFSFDAGRETELKGLAGRHRMHGLLWDQNSTG